MRVVITASSDVHYNHDTISVFDDDGREIVVRRGQLQELKHLLSKAYSTHIAGYQAPFEISQEKKRGG